MQDTRWKQRFNNYLKAFQTLVAAVELARSRDLSELEQQGLIHWRPREVPNGMEGC
jgi:hypothetical protein